MLGDAFFELFWNSDVKQSNSPFFGQNQNHIVQSGDSMKRWLCKRAQRFQQGDANINIKIFD